MPDTFRRRTSGAGPLHPLTVFVAVAAAGLVTVMAGSHLLNPNAGKAVAMAVFIGAMAVAGAGLKACYPHLRLGTCNMVTQGRVALLAILTVAITSPDTMDHSATAVFVIAMGALALDGVDGWLARRSGLASNFGARFDMEVDAGLAAILSLILIRAEGDDGAFALICLGILGFARYAFVAAACVLPWLNRPLPGRLSRRVVCVVQIAALAGALVPMVPDAVIASVLIIAAALVLWSFGRDIVWLARMRNRDA